MAARAYWQGQIRLALVSVAVEIYPATRGGSSIHFRQIHEPSGKPVRYEKVVAEIGPVDPGEIMKGYEISKGNYVLLEDEEIEAARVDSKRTLELVQFVDADEIDVLYYEKPYYVVPADELAEEAYIVLRDALRKTRKVGLGQLSVRGREYLVTLKPCGRGMILETLRYADEVNKAQGYFRSIGDMKPDPEMLDLAQLLIDRKSGRFDASDFRDHYADALHKLIERKARSKGRKIIEEVEEQRAPAGSNVVDLMAALKASVESRPSSRTRSKGPSPSPSSSSSASGKSGRTGGRKRA